MRASGEGGRDGLAVWGHPPARPFDLAQGERPHTKATTRDYHTGEGMDSGSGGGMTDRERDRNGGTV